jgi:cytochrome b6-f complex iron-sulfur subunit
MRKVLQGWKERLISRRAFLVKIGWAGIVTVLGGSVLASIRFFFPRVLFEPPAQFEIGDPDDFTPGKVDTSHKDDHRVCIVRHGDGSFYVVSLGCTHLGCTANWKPTEEIFHCSCHGSKFNKEGVNFAGPAPRPLDRFKVSLSPEGTLVVDKSVVYKGVAGKESDVLYPQSRFKV